MPSGSSRRTVLRFGVSAIVASIAGCSSERNSTPSPEDSQSPTQVPSLSPEPTATSSPTPEPVGTGNNPADLVIANQTQNTQSVSLRAKHQGGSTVFTETIEIEPGGRKRRDIIAYDGTGTFIITVRLADGTEESYEWELSEEPAGGWLYITIESNDTLGITYAIA